MSQDESHCNSGETDARDRPSPTRDWPTAMRRILPLAVCLGAITYFGTRRDLELPGAEILASDKILHAIAFGAVGALAYRFCAYCWPKLSGRWVVAVSVGVAAAWGAVLEVIQGSLPYRSMELTDLAADIFGAMACVAIGKHMRLERPLFGW